MYNKLSDLYKRYKIILDNIVFVALIQVFSLIAPLITYPYLVKVLGMDLYGIVITAQVLVGYIVLLIDFGSNSVCAKNISIYRNDKDKLSEIVSSVLLVRLKLWIVCFLLYLFVVLLIPAYREYQTLFVFSYLLTLNELLFLQFFFQGIEKMKVIALLNILVKLVFISLIFCFVRQKQDYLLVPLLYGIGYFVAGMVALFLVFKKEQVKFVNTNIRTQYKYVKECSPILATDMISTIKDRLNYMFVGFFVSMGDVVIYDLGLKLMNLIHKPSSIITTVLLPRFSKNRDVKKLRYVMFFVFMLSIFLVLLLNIFLPFIVDFFLHREIDLLPLRIFSLAPIFLSTSVVISNNFFIGFGYNKYVLYSIFVTTVAYVVALLIIWITGYINSLYSFVFLAVVSYFVELVYRLYMFRKLVKLH